jgi:hypothetical protein
MRESTTATTNYEEIKISCHCHFLFCFFNRRKPAL